MASFFITGPDQTAESLLNNEIGVVADTGTLFTSGTAITLDGQIELVVLGDVVSANSPAVLCSTPINGNISVASGGRILSSESSALAGNFDTSISIQNSGEIMGDENGLALGLSAGSTSGKLMFSNSGLVQCQGSVGQGGAALTCFGTAVPNEAFIVNTGRIVHSTGFALNLSSTAADVVNSGSMVGAVLFSGALNDRLVNSGEILGAITFADSADTLRNEGLIDGDVVMGDGTDRLVNHGTIAGALSMGQAPSTVEGATDAVDVLVNTGLIEGDVILSGGSDTFRNVGGQVLGAVYGGFGADKFFIDRSDIDIRDSLDQTASSSDTVFSTASYVLQTGIEALVLQGTLGLVGIGNTGANTISGGSGNDRIFGEDGADFLSGGRGDDFMSGGLGEDVIQGGREEDSLSGGDGNDLLGAGSGGGSLVGGAGTDRLDFTTAEAASLRVNLQDGSATAETGAVWVVRGIENVTGGDGNDQLTGSAGNNVLVGGAGSDTLLGGNGNDRLIGSTDADVLTGGSGADVFAFVSDTASPPGAADRISDFGKGADVIDLSAIDADPFTLDDQAFIFLGEAEFTGTAAEVRVVRDTVAGTSTVEAQLAGGASAFLVIVLNGQPVLSAAQFDL